MSGLPFPHCVELDSMLSRGLKGIKSCGLAQLSNLESVENTWEATPGLKDRLVAADNKPRTNGERT